MGSIDQLLADALMEHGIDLLRMDAGTRDRVVNILNRLQRELVSKLANEDLTAFTKARTEALLREVAKVIDEFFLLAQGELALTLQGSATVTAHATAGAIEGAIGVQIGVGLPTMSYLERLASNVLTHGAVTADWWDKLSQDTAFKVAAAIRQGLAQGETNQQIIARVAGKKGAPGVMDIARTNASALVQTSAQAVANDARLKTFEKNADIISALTWFTALDGHVCDLCMARSGLQWTNNADGSHEPIDHTIPFQNPPIHWGDRCMVVPKTKTYRELGIDMDEPAPSTRASSLGQVSAKTTFDEWLKTRSKEQQDEQLGVGRADLWRRGVITLRQLLDLKGNPLTLAQLKAKYA